MLTCGTSGEVAGPSVQLEDTPEYVAEHGFDLDPGDEEEYTIRASSSSVLQKRDAREHSQAVTSARFLLQLREGRHLSHVAISDVTTGCKTLCKQAVAGMGGVKATLRNAGISYESIPGLTDVLRNDPDPFQSIDTNYRFEKFSIEQLGCLVSPPPP